MSGQNRSAAVEVVHDSGRFRTDITDEKNQRVGMAIAVEEPTADKAPRAVAYTVYNPGLFSRMAASGEYPFNRVTRVEAARVILHAAEVTPEIITAINHNLSDRALYGVPA